MPKPAPEPHPASDIRSADDAILVLNAGSSSIKFRLYAGITPLVTGQIEGLGAAPHFKVRNAADGTTLEERDLAPAEATGHAAALEVLLRFLESHYPQMTIAAVGHRVVHGSSTYTAPVVMTAGIEQQLRQLIPLAPLHQPHNLAGIAAARQAFPKALQIACFDTAFHRTQPWVADTFALPRHYYEEGVRRYGFHGLSYEYICHALQEICPEALSGRLVVAHLGNGASMCAIKNGKSIGSTMGFTAVDGLPMGTRTGQLDPGVLLYLMTARGLTPDEITDLIYKQSGLKGLSGVSQDLRILQETKSTEAQLALDYFVHRIRHELGALTAELCGLDTLIFTAGIGENAPRIREQVCRDMDWLGIDLDPARNEAGEQIISSDASRVRVMVIPTNEEEMIRCHSASLLNQSRTAPPHTEIPSAS